MPARYDGGPQRYGVNENRYQRQLFNGNVITADTTAMRTTLSERQTAHASHVRAAKQKPAAVETTKRRVVWWNVRSSHREHHTTMSPRTVFTRGLFFLPTFFAATIPTSYKRVLRPHNLTGAAAATLQSVRRPNAAARKAPYKLSRPSQRPSSAAAGHLHSLPGVWLEPMVLSFPQPAESPLEVLPQEISLNVCSRGRNSCT